MGDSRTLSSLNWREEYYRDEMTRIVFRQRNSEHFSAGTSFYDLLKEMADDLIVISPIGLSQSDRQRVESYSQIFYAPAVRIALILHREQAAIAQKQHGEQLPVDVPVNIAVLRTYGNLHLDVNPFKSGIRQLEGCSQCFAR